MSGASPTHFGTGEASVSAFEPFGTTIFTVMSALASDVGAINLGQGFPDVDGPKDIREAAAAAVLNGPNQYPPMAGLPELRQAVADHGKRFYDLSLDWETEVLVTSGATEALTDCILGLVEPGDEVILIEPSYDSYLPIVLRAGGIPKFVRMNPPSWELPIDDLAAVFSSKTKLVMLNSPHNPTGKVFNEKELQAIADLAVEHSAYVICDEVYEHLVFDNQRHIPLMTLPGMRDRCLRIGSAGKTFSLTGWKIGYISGCADLVSGVAKAHQFNTFTTATPLQVAVATGLRKDQAYFDHLRDTLQTKRDLLSHGLRDVGFKVASSVGTYFVTCDIGGLAADGESDGDFCRRITTEAGVAAVPISAFYFADGPLGAGPQHFIRFCFCKEDSALTEAVARLHAYFQ